MADFVPRLILTIEDNPVDGLDPGAVKEKVIESGYNISYKTACTPSVDSDQSAHACTKYTLLQRLC